MCCWLAPAAICSHFVCVQTPKCSHFPCQSKPPECEESHPNSSHNWFLSMDMLTHAYLEMWGACLQTPECEESHPDSSHFHLELQPCRCEEYGCFPKQKCEESHPDSSHFRKFKPDSSHFPKVKTRFLAFPKSENQIPRISMSSKWPSQWITAGIEPLHDMCKQQSKSCPSTSVTHPDRLCCLFSKVSTSPCHATQYHHQEYPVPRRLCGNLSYPLTSTSG